MRILKTIGYILLTLIILWVIVAFLSPKEIKTSQTTIINKTPYVVFDQVNNLKLWNNWSPWIKRDKNMKQIFSDNHVGTGAVVSWESSTEGNGEQTIVESHAPNLIRTSLVFTDWDGITYANWSFEKVDENKTKVTWDLEGSELPFLLRPFGFSWNADLGKDYINGLKNLKEVCEKLPAKNENLRVRIVETAAVKYIGERISGNINEIGPAMGNAYRSIFGYISKHNIKVVGQPFSISYGVDNELIDVLVALPIKNEIKSADGYETGVLGAGHAAMISHFGNYVNLPATYQIITNWMKKQNYEMAGKSWEVYVTDPESEPDTAKWETQVYYPVFK
jgi:effector-binding domain-containing protein/ribosome-associated toxin RatA of RatAB toxin-antitoxin module